MYRFGPTNGPWKTSGRSGNGCSREKTGRMYLVDLGASVAAGRNYSLSSPSGVLKIDVAVGDTTAYAVWVAGEKAVVPSRIAMRLTDGRTLGDGARAVKISSGCERATIWASFYRQRLTGFTLLQNSLEIACEVVEFNFSRDYALTIPYADRRPDIFESSFEGQYI